MKRFKIKLMSLLLAVSLIIALAPSLPEKAEASFAEMPELSLDKCKKAEIFISDTAWGTDMEFIDGGTTNPEEETYAAITTYGGELCREVTKANMMNFKFTGDFASPEDDLFLFAFRYWDYAGGGVFYLDYSSSDGPGLTTRVEVSKRGSWPDGAVREDYAEWKWEYVVVAGAQFTQSLENGADFKIANRANNAFTKIEVYNLTPIKDEVALLELGTFATSKTTALFNMGLLPFEKVADATALLPNKLTREMALDYTVRFLGLTKEAQEANLPCPYSDVSEECKQNIAYAKKIGLINKEDSTLGAQDIIKERELLEYYLKYFNLPIDGDIIRTARDNEIIYGADVIFQLEKDALVDNLFAIGNNVVKKNAPNSKELIATQMLNKGILSFNDIMKSNDPVLMDLFLGSPFYHAPKEHIDPWNGKKWYSLNFFGGAICRPYMTQQTFSDDNETMAFCDSNGFIYTYNIRTYMVEKIGNIAMRSANVPRYVAMTFRNGSSELYYITPNNEIMMYDVKTKKTTLIATCPSNITTPGDLSVTADGTRIAFDAKTPVMVDGKVKNEVTSALYDRTEDKFYVKPVFNFDQGFASTTGYYSMHTAVNPVYKDVVVFCAGGSYGGTGLTQIYQRCYRWNIQSDEQGVFFDEYRTSLISGYGRGYGEQNCHESWTANGEWLVINKGATQYRGNVYTNGYPGIALISYDGRDRKYLNQARVWNEEKQIWTWVGATHPCADPVGERWVAHDDGAFNVFHKGEFPLIIRDTESGASYLALSRALAGPSDYHPHPAFSQNLQYLAFGLVDENGTGEIGWIDVSDITSIPQDGSRIQLSETCDALDFHNEWENFEYDLDIVEVDGETAYKIPRGKKMYINAINDYVWGTEVDVTFSITYLDNGISPMKLEYIKWNENGITEHFSRRYETIPRTGKGGWKTVDVTLKDVNMDNVELLGTDVKLSGAVSDIIIKEITVKEISDKE